MRGRLVLLVVVVVACKGGKAEKKDAAADAPLSGVGRGGTSSGSATGSAGSGTPATSTCRSHGTAKLESNAGVDASCVKALGAYRAFVIGRDGGPMLSVGVTAGKDGVKAGMTYALEGNKVIGAFFNEKEAKDLASKPLIQTVLRGIDIPADKGDLGLGKGTVTFRVLPEGDAAKPFEAEFDLTFETSKVVTQGANITSVKTGMTFHLSGSVVDR